MIKKITISLMAVFSTFSIAVASNVNGLTDEYGYFNDQLINYNQLEKIILTQDSSCSSIDIYGVYPNNETQNLYSLAGTVEYDCTSKSSDKNIEEKELELTFFLNSYGSQKLEVTKQPKENQTSWENEEIIPSTSDSGFTV